MRSDEPVSLYFFLQQQQRSNEEGQVLIYWMFSAAYTTVVRIIEAVSQSQRKTQVEVIVRIYRVIIITKRYIGQGTSLTFYFHFQTRRLLIDTTNILSHRLTKTQWQRLVHKRSSSSSRRPKRQLPSQKRLTCATRTS